MAFQRFIYAALTVVITVHMFVFYNTYVCGGDMIKQYNKVDFVLDGINKQGGIYMFGTYLPIWAVILIEIACAYVLEVTIAQPLSFYLARNTFNPAKTEPVFFESAIICSTVCFMCPAMSFLAAIFFYPYNIGFHFITVIANWFQLICYNFPFAYFTQTFLVQPFIRQIFKILFGGQQQQKQKQQSMEENKKVPSETASPDMTEKATTEDINNALKLIEQLRRDLLNDGGNTTVVESLPEEREIVEVDIH
ncbi:hypothetical protein PIROE2DRAFT_61542 [Piromyces sp. E2]|nr:hypothetical protein PIROE2DRAFT_61542 [Piromyces sp. E2]|eukprot:OUM62988.1 hypothetical protein PIROE2DRAFT_61542 [Piromyces sp. E2]